MRKSLTIIFALLFIGGALAKSAVLVDTAIVASNGKHKLLLSIPDNYDAANKYALVVTIQPCNGTSFKSYVQALQPLTDSLQMIVICPDNSKTSGWIADANMDIITVAIDSAMKMYNIDNTSVYLTGMSCNGEVALREGLKKLYPFKGIFPWDPYITGVNPKIIDLNSDMPTTIAVGTKDDYLTGTLLMFDSLKAHKANVNLVLVPNITHTFSFPNFGNEMIRALNYLNDTNNIVISQLNTNPDLYEILNTDGETIVNYTVSNENNKEIVVSALSSNPTIIKDPDVIYTPADGAVKLKFSPIAGKKGKVIIVLEAKEKSGTAIEQVTFKVIVKASTASVLSNELNSKIEVYPNPTSNILRLKNTESNLSIQITDINGRIVLKANNVNTDAINISNLKTGLYFLKAIGKTNYNTVKFSVK